MTRPAPVHSVPGQKELVAQARLIGGNMAADTVRGVIEPGTAGERYEVVHAKSPVFFERYERKSELQEQTHYCPGCGHGIVHKLIAEALEDSGLQDRTILVSPVGCSVFAYHYFDLGNVQAAHGRAPAVATGIKRSCPDSIVLTYQGDGDLAGIGTAEILHAANRGENITVFFINNAIYGMTGGQMAPTTLVGQRTTTTPWGRHPANEGYPLHVAELVATLEAPSYVERVALSDNKNIMRARRAVRKAIEVQRDGLGFSLVEILSACPTVWGLEPVEARTWVAEHMVPVFPLGIYRDRRANVPVSSVPQRPVGEVLEFGMKERKRQSPVFSAPAKDGHRVGEMKLKIAGFGGQGVLVLGQLLAEMGMREGLEVSWLPSYGPQMRSGSAHCHVFLSNEPIGSPLISHPNVLIAMNEVSLRKFAPEVTPGGLILYNHDSLPPDLPNLTARMICVPASEIADRMGSPKAANVVMLGALLENTGRLSADNAARVIEDKLNHSLREVNLKALSAGREFVKAQHRLN
jgi:2-oxoisovalerate ferredoxin oxidoreductase beta subunit